MEKNYAAFIVALKEELLDATDFTKDNIYFEEKGGRYAGAGDRLFIECAVHENAREVCGVYTKELFERFKNGTPMEYMIDEIIQAIDRAKNLGFFDKTQNLNCYDLVKNDLFIRLLNKDQNKEELNRAIYRTIGDIALVLYLKIGEENGCITSMKIRQNYIEEWGEQEEDVFQDALLNTYFMSQPRIFRWEKLLFDSEYEGENFMNLSNRVRINKDAVGNCLSTIKRTNGAVAVFLPGVARRLGELLDADFYLVFTSVHEVMVHNEREVEPEDLAAVLADTIREATPDEDYLTSDIYYYCRETEEFSRVEIE